MPTTATVPALTPVEGWATATATTETDGSWRVDVVFHSPTPVDRAGEGYAYALRPTHARLAQRLVRAINDQKVFTDYGIGTDINNRTYLHARSVILTRTLNADLTRMGY